MIPRPDLQRVWDGLGRNDLLYTSRSSSEGVTSLNVSMKKNEFIRVIERDGSKHEGHGAKVSDSEIVPVSGANESPTANIAIVAVEYVRLKPVGDTANWEARHGLFARPDKWQMPCVSRERLHAQVFAVAA